MARTVTSLMLFLLVAGICVSAQGTEWPKDEPPCTFTIHVARTDGSRTGIVSVEIWNRNTDDDGVFDTDLDGNVQVDQIPFGEYVIDLAPQPLRIVGHEILEYCDANHRDAHFELSIEPAARVHGHIPTPFPKGRYHTITVVKVTTEDGHRVFHHVRNVGVPKDTGDFVIGGLEPGDYVFRYEDSMDDTSTRAADGSFPTYFPGTLSRREATVYHLEAGSDVALYFKRVQPEGHKIEIHVPEAEGHIYTVSRLSLWQRDLDDTAGAQFALEPVQIVDQHITLSNIPDGCYEVIIWKDWMALERGLRGSAVAYVHGTDARVELRLSKEYQPVAQDKHSIESDVPCDLNW